MEHTGSRRLAAPPAVQSPQFRSLPEQGDRCLALFLRDCVVRWWCISATVPRCVHRTTTARSLPHVCHTIRCASDAP
eukprot:6884485-Prymnesium_polylepis.1